MMSPLSGSIEFTRQKRFLLRRRLSAGESGHQESPLSLLFTATVSITPLIAADITQNRN